MGASLDYLDRDRRSGRLLYRRVIPRELRPYVPGNVWEMKRTLAATVYNPEAARRFAEAADEYDRVIAVARKVAAGQFDELESPEIARLAELYRVAVIAADESARFDGSQRSAYFNPESHDAKLDALTDAYASAVTNPNVAVEWMGEDAQELLAREGQRVDPNSSAYRLSCGRGFAAYGRKGI